MKLVITIKQEVTVNAPDVKQAIKLLKAEMKSLDWYDTSGNSAVYEEIEVVKVMLNKRKLKFK